ncbi:MAG: hypothetical protein WAN66_14755 [Limnoraphis robusta]|uniref:hypothetical protein n=1 Tax=Limnoraphis robusta TaxID=1118279 RepID=UPI001364A4CF|nr:hypothetical protein [Limnoraphis robusta]
MVIKVGKAGLNGSNDESDIKSCLAPNYVYERNFRYKYRHGNPAYADYWLATKC